MATKTATSSGRNVAAELAYLTRTLKAPSLAAAVERLAEQARAESWTHEEFLAACLQREVAARESHGGEARIRAARFPACKALEDFDFDHQRSLKRDTIAHLGALDFRCGERECGVPRPIRHGKTHLSIGLCIRACQAGHRVAFATAAEWVARLAVAHHAGPAAGRDHQVGPHPAADRRRGGLHPVHAADSAARLSASHRRGACRRGTGAPEPVKNFDQWSPLCHQ